MQSINDRTTIGLLQHNPWIDMLSEATRDRLAQADISTLYDLLNKEPGELLEIEGFGRQSLEEVVWFLKMQRRLLDGSLGAQSLAGAAAWSTEAATPLHALISSNAHYALLSNRTRNRLDTVKIFSLSELIEWDESSLLDISGFGTGCLGEVNAFLEANGLLPVRDVNEGSAPRKSTLRGYEALPEETRTVLNEAGVRHEQDLRETSVQRLLELPGVNANTVDQIAAAGVMPQPRNVRDLLLTLYASETIRSKLENLDEPYADSILNALARCRAKVEEQVEVGILHEEALMDYGLIQSFNRRLRPPAREILDLLSRIQYLPGQGTAKIVDKLSKALDVPTVEGELSLLLGRFEERDIGILRARFALGKRPTLNELGTRFRVSRERIRQIEKTDSEKLREAYYWEDPLPRIRTAMLLVKRNHSVSPAEIYDLLLQRSLVASEDTVADLLAVWRAIDPSNSSISDILQEWRVLDFEDYAFPEDTISFAKTGLDLQQQAASSEILRVATPLVRQVGAVATAHIVEDFSDYEITKEDVAAVLTADNMREVLPGYWARAIGKPVPYTVVKKMLAICGPLNLRQLRRGLIRHQRRQGYPVAPMGVLRAVLEQYNEFNVGADDVVHLRKTNVSVKLGNWERVWLKLVEGKGPVVHTDSIHRAFAKNRLRPITASVLMRKSSLVEPVGKQLFCLPGSRITDEDIDCGKTQALKIDPDPYLTYDEMGDVVYEATAQQYMDRNGSLSAGPASVMEGRWKTVVDGEEIGDFTVGQPWIYGLSEARDALDLHAGDRMGICFDTWTRKGHVYLVARYHDH